MNWKIEDAQQNWSTVLQAAAQEPQLIYEQDRLIAAIVEPEAFQEFLAWKQQHSGLPQALKELRQICLEENYTLDIPPRQDRPEPFVQ
jgi:hypothetical protein